MTKKRDEQDLMNKIRLTYSNGDTRLFRQNTGEGWIGSTNYVHRNPRPRTVTINQGDVVIRDARRFIAGFPGLPDLGGWRTVTVTPEMVGTRLAVYVGLEVKTPTGSVRAEQKNFLKLAKDAGAVAAVVRSVEDAGAALHGDENKC